MARRATVNDSPVNVRLPADLHAAVVERARAEDRTIAQTIRVALRFYLAETKPIAPMPNTRPSDIEPNTSTYNASSPTDGER